MNRVLIVDDNPNNVQVLATVLASNNYDVEYAMSGDEALELLKEDDFNLVLLDIMMPEKDGYEVCTEIKADKKNENLPIVFLTAKTDMESLSKAFDVGGIDYINKPFNETELLKRVETHLNLFQSRKELKQLNSVITLKNDEINQSLNYSTRIQRSVLPDEELIKDTIPEGFVIYQPKDMVSGDFYSVYNNDEYSVIVLGDCTGHGIPGAMLSMLGLSILNNISFATLNFDSARVLEEFREQLKKFTIRYASSDSIDLGLCIYDKKKKHLKFSGAKIPLVVMSEKELIVNPDSGKILCIDSDESDNKLYYIKGNKNTAGFDYNESPFSAFDIELKGGEQFYLFSDGIVDQFGGEKGKKMKRSGLFNHLLSAVRLENFNKRKEYFEEVIASWKNDHEQVDDITLMGFSLI